MGDRLTVYEVGPRDGLQNGEAPIPTEQKNALVDRLVRAGIRSLELTSFVSPKAVPQLSDAAEVVAVANRLKETRPDLRLSALVINEKGYERALAAGVEGVAVVVPSSESLCQRNNRCSVQEALATARHLLSRAKTEHVLTRVYLAVAWVCPYEGPVRPDQVVRCCDAIWEEGCDELALADTIGHAHPLEVGHLFEQLGKRYGTGKLAAHFHDTQALGLANAVAAIQAGIRTIDSSVGGLGGCPFAPGAAGNLATEDLVLLAEKMGFETGIDLDQLWSVVQWFRLIAKRSIGGRTMAWWESTHEATFETRR